MPTEFDRSVSLKELSLLLGNTSKFEDLKTLLEEAITGSLDPEDSSEAERLLREEVIARHQGDMVETEGDPRCLEEILVNLAREFGNELPLLNEVCGPVDYWLEELRRLYLAAKDVQDMNSGSSKDENAEIHKQKRKFMKQQKRWNRLFCFYSKNFPLNASTVITNFLLKAHNNGKSNSNPGNELKLYEFQLCNVFDYLNQSGGEDARKCCDNKNQQKGEVSGDVVDKTDAPSGCIPEGFADSKQIAIDPDRKHKRMHEDGDSEVIRTKKVCKTIVHSDLAHGGSGLDTDKMDLGDECNLLGTARECHINKASVDIDGDQKSIRKFKDGGVVLGKQQDETFAKSHAIELDAGTSGRCLEMVDLEQEKKKKKMSTTPEASGNDSNRENCIEGELHKEVATRIEGGEHIYPTTCKGRKMGEICTEAKLGADIGNAAVVAGGDDEVLESSKKLRKQKSGLLSRFFSWPSNEEEQSRRTMSLEFEGPVCEDQNAVTFATNTTIPEILFYADILDRAISTAKNNDSTTGSGRMLRSCLLLFETLEQARRSNLIEDRQRVNNQYLPEMRNLNRLFYCRWITRNCTLNSWISAPQPDFADKNERATRLNRMMTSLAIDDEFSINDYNYVFLRKDGTEIKQIIHRWINSSKDDNSNPNQIGSTKMSTKELVSIVFNLLRRQEDWEQDFIKVLSRLAIQERKVADVAEMLTAKGLFYVAFQHSTPELRMKLIQDFAAAGHAVPLVYPEWPHQNVLNPFVYHSLPATCSVGVFNLGIGTEACYQLGKTELVNHMLGTGFDSGKSSFFNYGTVDLDCGMAFHPDRKICVAHAHGRLDQHFYPILACFSIILVHVSAKDLCDGSAVVRKDLQQLKAVLYNELFPENGDTTMIKGSSSRKLFLLIRDAGFCNLSENFVDAKEEILTVFPLIKDVFGQGGEKLKNRFFPMAFPDLRAGGTLDEKIQIDVLECRLRKPILTKIYSDVKTLTKSGKSKGTKFMSKENFTECIVKQFVPGTVYNKYAKLNKFIDVYMSELYRFKNDFFDEGIFPVRCRLRKLRKCEKKLTNQDVIDCRVVEETLAHKAEILAELQASKPSESLNRFLSILGDESDAITGINELALQLKLFSKANVAKELVQQAELRKQIHDLGKGDDINKSLERRAKLERKLKEVCIQIDQKVFSVEVPWRETMALCNLGSTIFGVSGQEVDAIQGLTSFVLAGEPFELIDGDNLKLNSTMLSKVFADNRFVNKRVFVVSVLGPQSSGKSTLLNFLFGSKFSTGTGRCTKGIYANCINIDHPNYDIILILDTEGLQSVEKDDDEFDRKITLFCLAVSHLVIINVKGDMHNTMKRLLEICILSLVQFEKAKMATPQVCWCFNQNPVPDKLPFLKQIEGITTEVIGANPDAQDAVRFMEVQNEDLFVLSFAFNIRTIGKNPSDSGQLEDWQLCQPRSDFAVEVACIAKRIKTLMSHRATMKQSQRLYEYLHSWVEMAAENWKTIENYPDLVSFADVKEMKDNQILLKAAEDWESIFIKNNMTDHESAIRMLLDENIEKRKVQVNGYIKGQEGVIKSKVREYFDGIYLQIEKKLRGLAHECEFRRQMVETYQHKIRCRVDSYYHEFYNHVTQEIQRTVSEVGRTNGLAQLEAKMMQMLRSEKSYTEKEAAMEFTSTYEKIVSSMTEDLDESGSMNGTKDGSIAFGRTLFTKDASSKLSAVLFNGSARAIFQEGDKNALPTLNKNKCKLSNLGLSEALQEGITEFMKWRFVRDDIKKAHKEGHMIFVCQCPWCIEEGKEGDFRKIYYVIFKKDDFQPARENRPYDPTYHVYLDEYGFVDYNQPLPHKSDVARGKRDRLRKHIAGRCRDTHPELLYPKSCRSKFADTNDIVSGFGSRIRWKGRELDGR